MHRSRTLGTDLCRRHREVNATHTSLVDTEGGQGMVRRRDGSHREEEKSSAALRWLHAGPAPIGVTQLVRQLERVSSHTQITKTPQRSGLRAAPDIVPTGRYRQ